MNAKEIFQKLVERAMFSVGLLSSLRRKPGKPGEWIEKLSPEEREELQNLTSKDVKSTDRNILYIGGMYPENTMTIHTHADKKDSDE